MPKRRIGEVNICFGELDASEISARAGEILREIIEERVLDGEIEETDIRNIAKELEQRDNIFLP